jgi:hypothetical protein
MGPKSPTFTRKQWTQPIASFLSRFSSQVSEFDGVPSAVHSWESISVCPGMFQQGEEVISGDNSRRDKVVEGSHGQQYR